MNTNTAHELAIYDAAITYAEALAASSRTWMSQYSTINEQIAADVATTAANRALLEALNDKTVTAITNRYNTEAGR